MKMEEIVKATHGSYQLLTTITAAQQLQIAAFGMCGEAGEFSEHIKKNMEHGRAIDADKLKLELADVLYYVHLACLNLGTTPEELSQLLFVKLASRYPERFA